MPVTTEQFQQLQEKFDALEKIVRLKTEDLQTRDTALENLIRENKREIVALKQKNEELEKKLVEMEKEKIHQLRKDCNALDADSMNLRGEVSVLRLKIEAMECYDRKFETLTIVNENFKNDIENLTKDVQKIEALEEKLVSFEKEGMAAIKYESENLKSEIADLVPKVQKTEALEKKLVSFEKEGMTSIKNESENLKFEIADLVPKVQLQALIAMIESFEERNNIPTQSFTSIAVRHKGLLTTGQAIKMDECHYVSNQGMADLTDGSIQCKWKGVYMACIKYVQDGVGEIRMHLKGDMFDVLGYIGRTDSDGDKRCYVNVLKIFEQGDKMWLEALRTNGDARILYCTIQCLCLSPLLH